MPRLIESPSLLIGGVGYYDINANNTTGDEAAESRRGP